MKKTTIVASILIFTIVIGVFAMGNLEAKPADFKIIFEGNEVRFNNSVVTINGRTYLPLLETSLLLGVNCSWNEEKRQVEISRRLSFHTYEPQELEEDFEINKETALKIGKAVLEQCFEEQPWDETPINAVDKGDIWKVHNVVERYRILDDGTEEYIHGGEIYVEILKSNGEIMSIGVND